MIKRKLLVLDASFSYEAIVKRGLKSSVTCRDLDGFFSHVWSVHPFSTLVTSSDWCDKFGHPLFHEINKKHTFIEGKVGWSKYLNFIPPLNFLIAQFQIFIILLNLIHKEKITIIRVGDPLYLGLLGYVLSKLTRVPYVVRVGANNEKIRSSTGRGMMPRLFVSINLERFVEKFVLSRADLVAGANNDNLNFAISSGARKEKCTIFRYGNLIDSRHFLHPSLRNAYYDKLTNNDFILCIARLELVKKVDDVIRVLAKVRGNGFEVKALLVGEGREQSNLEQLAIKLGVWEHVIFCGNKDQQWLSSSIPKAAVAISPHTGRALTEVALGSVPIAAYDVDWQAELIQTGQTGEIVAFGDWQALAASTIKLLSDKAYAQNMGINVRKKALEMMNPEKLNVIEQKCYSNLLGESNL